METKILKILKSNNVNSIGRVVLNKSNLQVKSAVSNIPKQAKAPGCFRNLLPVF